MSAAPLHDVEIELTDGWAGRVLLAAPGAHAGTHAARLRLTPDDWRAAWATLAVQAVDDHAPSVIKLSSTGHVSRFSTVLAGEPLDIIAKLHRPQGSLRRALAPLLPSRACAAWEKATALLTAGIPTAPPLAALERRSSRESLLLTEALSDARELSTVVRLEWPRLDAQQCVALRRRLIERTADIAAALHRAGLAHRDLKAPNLMVTDRNGEHDGPFVWLIDLDGISLRRTSDAVPLRGSLARLAASFFDASNLTLADRRRFLRRYLAQAHDAADWRSVWRELSAAVQRRTSNELRSFM
jgi:hypothetical protein